MYDSGTYCWFWVYVVEGKSNGLTGPCKYMNDVAVESGQCGGL